MSTEEVLDKFNKLSAKKRAEILYDALDYMQQYNSRTKETCICYAMGYSVFMDDEGEQVWKKKIVFHN